MKEFKNMSVKELIEYCESINFEITNVNDLTVWNNVPTELDKKNVLLEEMEVLL